MKTKKVSVPELGMIAGTRMALGAGIGLLLADYLDPGQRRAIGWTLAAVGVVSTIPLAAQVLFRSRTPEEERLEKAPVPPQEMSGAL